MLGGVDAKVKSEFWRCAAASIRKGQKAACAVSPPAWARMARIEQRSVPAALSHAVCLVYLQHRVRAPQPHLSGPQVNVRVLELDTIVGVPEINGARSKGAKEEMAMVTDEGTSGVDDVGLLEVA